MANVIDIKHLHDLLVLFLDADLPRQGREVVIEGQRFAAIWPSSSVVIKDSVAVTPGDRPDSFFLDAVVSVAN